MWKPLWLFAEQADKAQINLGVKSRRELRGANATIVGALTLWMCRPCPQEGKMSSLREREGEDEKRWIR